MQIIALQQHSMGPRFFLNNTLRGSAIRIDDIDLYEMPDICLKAIISNTPQILIVGSINGSAHEGSNFIKDAKEKNPQLLVIGFSSEMLTGCNVFVNKRDCRSGLLAQAITRLRSQFATT